MSEVDKFFEGLEEPKPEKAGIFDPEKQDPEKEGSEPKPEEGEGRKNRRHRRLETQLQQERELRIAAEARAAGRAEAESGQRETAATGDVPDKWLRIYGDTPESRLAWQLQKETIAEEAGKAKDAALAEIEQREKSRKDEQTKFESFIDAELESIEDEYDVDVTSDAPAARKARREFLELVAELSPKDEDGSISAYVDFDAAWKQYSKTKEKKAGPDAARRKELAGRSQGNGNAEADAPSKRTPGFFGWQRDLGQ